MYTTKVTQRHTVIYVRVERCKHTLQLYDYSRFTPTLKAINITHNYTRVCLIVCIFAHGGCKQACPALIV